LSERARLLEKLLQDRKFFLFGIAAGLIFALEISVFWGLPLEYASRSLNQTLVSSFNLAPRTLDYLLVVGAAAIFATYLLLERLARGFLRLPDWTTIDSIEHQQHLNALSLVITKLLVDFCTRTGFDPQRKQEAEHDVINLMSKRNHGAVARLIVTKDDVQIQAWRSDEGRILSGRVSEFLDTRRAELRLS
jgi:hypothetical protein